MFTLKDITTYSLIYLKLIPEKECALFQKYHITNFQELEHQLGINEELSTPLIFELMRLARKLLKDISEQRINPPTFTWNYEKNWEQIAKSTDKATKGNVLFYNVIAINSGYYENSLNSFDILTLKYLTSMLALNGKNAACACVTGIGPKKLIDLISKIRLYDDQINRVIKSLNKPQDINLFLYQLEEKRKIVEDYKLQIISYLFSLSTYFTFGHASKQSQEIILNILKNNIRTKRYNDYLNTILDFIASYTTLEELETKHSRELALQRFIKE